MQKYQEKINEFFETYPNETECLLFSDGQIFTIENEDYAKIYKGQSGNDYSKVGKSEVKKEASKREAEKTPEEMTKKELIALADEKGIEINSRDKVDEIRQVILTALESSEEEKEELDSDGEKEDDYKPVND